MSRTIQFETKKYKFKVYKEPRNETRVFVDVVPKFSENLNEDKEEILNAVKDMGKWEALIKAGQLLFRDVGIERESP